MLSTVDPTVSSSSVIPCENGTIQISLGGCETIGFLVERAGVDHGILLSPNQARKIADGLYASAEICAPSA